MFFDFLDRKIDLFDHLIQHLGVVIPIIESEIKFHPINVRMPTSIYREKVMKTHVFRLFFFDFEMSDVLKYFQESADFLKVEEQIQKMFKNMRWA